MSDRANDRPARSERRGSPALEAICEAEWLAWYRLTPQERWAESMRLLEIHLAWGGSLDPEPDDQSPFYFPEEPRPVPVDGGAGERRQRPSRV